MADASHLVVPVRNAREARQEADACNTPEEIFSMLTAIARERRLLWQQHQMASLYGTPAQRFLAHRILKRRSRILNALHRRLTRRFSSIRKTLKPTKV